MSIGIRVGVAQLVELRFVVPAVGGSSPLVHPIFSLNTILYEVIQSEFA